MKWHKLLLILILFIGARFEANAQSSQFGALLGAMGAGDEVDDTDIGIGAYFLVKPFPLAGFYIDLIYTKMDNVLEGSYLATTQNMVFSLIDSDEFSTGPMAGIGFYNFSPSVGEGDGMKFGANLGYYVDMSLSDRFSVGLQGNYHFVSKIPDLWSVFLRLTIKFDIGGWG